VIYYPDFDMQMLLPAYDKSASQPLASNPQQPHTLEATTKLFAQEIEMKKI